MARSPARRTSGRRVTVICGGVAALLVAMLAVYRPSAVARLDDSVYDHVLRGGGTTPPRGGVVIVDIDEASLATYGQWPWRRDLIARLVARLRDGGASVVALDIIFAERDRSAEHTDDAFADALRAGGVVLGYGLTFDDTSGNRRNCRMHPFPVAVVQAGDGAESSPLFRATGAICSLPHLAEAAGASGFLNAAPDSDGILRRVPVLAELDGHVYPSLALAAVTAVTHTRGALLRAATVNSASLQLPYHEVPLDARGNLLLRFRGKKKAFPYVSAADVLNGRVQPAAVRDKIVLVGTTALGTREVVATPLDTLFAGVEVQATVADNLLYGDFVRRPEHRGEIESIVTLAAGLAVALLIGRFGLTLGTAVAACGLGSIWCGAVWTLARDGLFVSPLFPTLGWCTSFSVAAAVRFSLERRRADTAGMERTAARTLMIQALLSLTEVRDAETGRHSRRTQQYTKLLAEQLARHPRFRAFLTPERIDMLSSLAPLHDIGKVGVPDSILNKPGDLTPDEMAEMRRHPVYGRDVILKAEQQAVVRDDAILSMAKEIVYTHHERWDGSGYPEGLRGEDIPIAGRILAVVDVYDAVTGRTLYRPAMSHDKALAFIASGQGSHFDPAVVDALVCVAPAFEALSAGDGLALAGPAGGFERSEDDYRSASRRYFSSL